MSRVLVIDDNEDMRELLRLVLTHAGYEVELAHDGEAGVRAQRARPADLVITDIFMPNRDGFETIVELRSAHPGVKLVAVSGGGSRFSGEGYLAAARAAGADAALPKPFEQEELLRTVRRLLP